MMARITFEKVISIFIIVACVLTENGVYAQGRIFKAGASISNITPYLGDGIVGNFGTPPPATYIHDQLHTRSLVLDDGNHKLVFVICDNVSINREVFDEAKRMIREATGIPNAYMMMSATHTHSGTSAGGEGEKRRGWHPDTPLDAYQKFMATRIADGVRGAIANLEPARIGWGVGSVPQHVFNRRWKMKPGKTVLNPFGEMDQVLMNPGSHPDLLEPAGPTDPDLSFLSVQSITGKPIAVLANYSLHYVGGIPSDHISADYFAVFADRIQELLKADRQDPPFVGIMSNGTSGDVNNINVKGQVEKRPAYEKIRLVAHDVAREILRVYRTTTHHDWVELKAAESELQLNVRKPTNEQVRWAQQVVTRADTVKPKHRLEKTYAERTLQMQEWPEQINVILQTYRVGELGIAAIPFETFAETGLEIKAKSPFRPTFTIELANGGYGYLPTPEQHKLGGYETWLSTNRVEKEATQKIVAELLSLFSTMK
ncbi:neutral/alkaline non-lysosomal ceramidase N-terminal domain-containing protein [Dyadobacter sp. 32]|uniref:neutral/alkaline non-lysosomal ceramidase N-terminal domain-containing protein n=1 Tax=Dyadobacter sp. 32 TaxID=538966 RepID=UPI0011EEFE82